MEGGNDVLTGCTLMMEAAVSSTAAMGGRLVEAFSRACDIGDCPEAAGDHAIWSIDVLLS